MTAEIGGVSVLAMTVGVFDDIPEIRQIILPVKEGRERLYREILSRHRILGKVSIIQGGHDRTTSVINGFSHVKEDTDVLLVHDAARPLVDRKLIRACMEAGAGNRCCAAGVLSRDTVKMLDGNNRFSATLDRNRVCLVQTPQAFPYPVAKEMYRYAVAENIQATDDATLAEKLGFEIFLIPSDETNLKITTDADIRLAEGVLHHRQDTGA